ncbi:ABC transporter transmembrane region domain-containing protein [Trichoderma breve]|uniref:ABC transporter transmembrane region domain-containing protein n=1 Tax=Trichoderma breve TaxID=2034170 RepID=A0A9W9B961_9HYPO|nr:ABC transporter transmembrane region domain-containing protein [Trichoderma breve]KAJ4858942.1 ABC transporter transmembrane region domain-containing protein [Trichoderma breve]
MAAEIPEKLAEGATSEPSTGSGDANIVNHSVVIEDISPKADSTDTNKVESEETGDRGPLEPKKPDLIKADDDKAREEDPATEESEKLGVGRSDFEKSDLVKADSEKEEIAKSNSDKPHIEEIDHSSSDPEKAAMVKADLEKSDPKKEELEKADPEKPDPEANAELDADSNGKKKNKAKTEKKQKPSKEPEVKEDPEEPFRHLPDNEAEILKRQALTPDLKHGVAALYRYTTGLDIFIMIIASVCSIANGAALPLMTLLFGGLQKTFSEFTVGQIDKGELSSQLAKYVLYFVYLAIGQFVVTYIATVGFIYVGENISTRIREHYLESCLRQNIGFFDKIGTGEIVTRITSDTNTIQDGISEKVSITIGAISTFVTAFVIAFANYWKLTLILASVIIAILLNGALFSSYMLKNGTQSIVSSALGGGLADEVLSSVRTAVAFGAQDRLSNQYNEHLKKAEYFGFRLKSAVGVMLGGIMFLLYMSYALAFWQGSAFVLRGELSLNQALIVMMTVIMGAFNMTSIAPNFQAFISAVSAASKIFDTIDRVSPINSASEEGETIDQVEGNIRLENVKHIYPSRPGAIVMEDVTLDIPAGKTTALVGASGSGKSTIVGLIERFYNPVGGTLYLDGHDISKLNLRWLRRQISLVSQEPTLFGTSIFENIRYGLVGTEFEKESEEKQREMVIAAAKKSNAHDFVSALSEGYETNVGDRGFLLSGGQKQRIAIARAIVSDPKILLLDEATSALDTKSEGIVQAALEAASAGRTTIIIAHRLSTIKDAHNIVVMSQGRIIEQGTHDELVEKGAAYHKLVSAQNITAAQGLTSEEQELIDDHQEALIKRQSKIEDSEIFSAEGGNKEAKYSIWSLIAFIAKFNRNEWKRMSAGLFFSILCGGASPISAVFFSKEIVTLTNALLPNANIDQIRHDAYFWAVMFIVLAVGILISYSGQGIAFASCSEHLIHRIRDQSFRTFLRQDISFFDRKENSAGILTAFLSTEANNIGGLSGSALGTILLTLSTLFSSMIMGLALGWKLALVCTATIPVLLACGFFRFYLLLRFQSRAKDAYAASAAYASEAISSIRTVASLTREQDIIHMYREDIAAQRRKGLKSVLSSSALYGAAQGASFLCFGLGFWYGGTLLATREYDLFTFFVCFMGIIYSAQAAGSIFSLAPDMGKAHASALALKKLFERTPKIDAWSKDGQRIAEGDIQGTVEFRDVHFRYPTRPDQPVLRGLNLTIKPGQYVALVGASGCGKSTTISLLERFYDPLSGGVFVDGQDIGTLNVSNYRSFVSLVSQEPALYSGTIKENVLLGTPEEDISEERLEHVCREANIYDFIISLSDGFNTFVGSKGGLLSGGQKQRIAIARALIRNPKILLLDEATSALDSESEFVVQEALDKAAAGRTTIAVAHRLSTIQKADVIYVIDQGRVAESGTHQELMRKNGHYAELVNLQSLATSS